MQKISSIESSKIITAFIEKLKKGLKKSPSKVEYFNLTLKEPIFEKLNCAYLQTSDLKEGILYEAVTNRFFYVKSDKIGTISMSSLTKSVSTDFPRLLKDKMFWVCGNKKDKEIELIDFGGDFILSKPIK